jgi:DNA-binding IclR family transcriptional regulator
MLPCLISAGWYTKPGSRRMSASYNRFTRKTISSREMFMLELARVRRLGYSMDDEEEELGIRCVAAPILSVGNVSAAVSVTGTVSQIQIEDVDKVVALTRHAAARISASI